MEKIGDLELYTLEEVLDEHFGPVGTPRRDEHEKRVEEELHAYRIGEAIKEARLQKNLTQEQFGALMGVQKAQVSRIEKGRNLTFSTLSRAFKAMGIPANLAFGSSSFALW